MKKFGILIFAAAAFLGILLASIFSFGCGSHKIFNVSFGTVKGSGNVVTEARDVKGFKGVDVSGAVQAEIAAGKDFSVEVEADDNIIPLIKTEVRGGVLHIETEKSISSRNGLKVRISAPDIDDIAASGASKVNLANVKNAELRVNSSGASKINVSGETAKVSIDVSGASSIDAENLRAESADVNASGASNASVFARNELRTDASGASKIVYAGGPKTVDKNASGASSIRER